MTEDLGYHYPGNEMGGPMNIGENYRWNIPVITYGFDQSFLNYFGSNGVAAVESAVEMLNDLPAASAMDIASYEGFAWAVNYQAREAHLLDLKSYTLSLLLEQIGLTGPEQNVWTLRWRFLPDGFECPDYDYGVIQRNFDPLTLQPSKYVNDNAFTYTILEWCQIQDMAICSEIVADPLAPHHSSASEFPEGEGRFVMVLTRDDVGGLRYLLSGNQIRNETLPADVHGVGPGASNYVATAYRPGIEKITFVRHPHGALAGESLPCTNQWIDLFYVGNFPQFQPVERITTRPDILFSARDIFVNNRPLAFARTTTSNWVNQADINGNPGGAGPGVIVPPITIAFNNAGPFSGNFRPSPSETTGIVWLRWGSFDDSTNTIVTYPSTSVATQTTPVKLDVLELGSTNTFHWRVADRAYGLSQLQTSTSLTNWTSITSITNSGVPVEVEYLMDRNEPQRFFRIVTGGF